MTALLKCGGDIWKGRPERAPRKENNLKYARRAIEWPPRRGQSAGLICKTVADPHPFVQHGRNSSSMIELSGRGGSEVTMDGWMRYYCALSSVKEFRGFFSVSRVRSNLYGIADNGWWRTGDKFPNPL